MNEIFNRLRKVYNHLADDISKKLFIARLNYSFTFDDNFIIDIPNEYRNLNADVETFYRKLYSTNGKKLAIFGAGMCGQSIAIGFKGLKFECFIDNYRKDDYDKRTGLPIYSIEKYIDEYGVYNTIFIISVVSTNSVESIIKQLLEYGVEEENIIYLKSGDWRNNCSQYFDLFSPHEHEVFVDCGCFNGSTAFRFAAWCGVMGYDKIWSFEPDKESYEKCKNVLAHLGKCEVLPYGISDKKGTVSFLSNGKEDARIVNDIVNNDDLHTIDTISLDEFLKNEKVTFIKMDIEGAEFDAIKGAKNIIKDQKPRLAISVYHNSQHIITIPELLLNLRPDYKLYIRHYSLLPNETILYAE